MSNRRLLFVASERPKYQDARGYAGAHGRLLDRFLAHAGCSRDNADVVFSDRYRPEMASEYDVVVLGGEWAMTEALGWFNQSPTTWHGSVLPQRPQPPTSYDAYRSWLLEPPKFVLTFDIVKLHQMWEWHPLAAGDWQRAGAILRGEYAAPNPDNREWVISQPWRLQELADSRALVFDTELTPTWMIGFANDRQVHVCDWGWQCEQPARALLQSPTIVKVAHNLQHDLAMCDLRFGFPVLRPYFDTYGGATLLNTALERTLSPGIASRFTNWPYHKWLTDVDATRYNGLDNIVAYDAYVEITRQLQARGLSHVAEHDHNLLEALYEMQRDGFRISEGERAAYELEQTSVLSEQEADCAKLAEPIIRARLSRFTKPHLFYVEKQCTCCGGGAKARKHCWRCGGLAQKPAKKADYFQPAPGHEASVRARCVDGCGKLSVAQLSEMLPACKACNATGKVGHWLPYKPSSSDATGDVIYRGLGIRPRMYKGRETTAAAQLEPIQDKHPLIAAVVTASKTRADLSTVERLRPGTDGKLHCVFDPWGTESGRVASREGLLEPGTNAMNIPKKARRFVVPDAGHVFLYPDFAQIEARAVAVLSQDRGLIRAFTVPLDLPGHPKHGKIDSHTVVQLLVSRYVQITRDQAKRLTYACMYGGSGEQLAIELSKEAMQKGEGGLVTAAQGCAMVEAFFLAFPGVRQWHAAIERELLQNKYLTAPSGRQRHWPGRIVDVNTGGVLHEVIKQAWAFKPQEMGAHIMALGVMDVRRKYPRELLRPLVHVHDAVLFQAPRERQDEAVAAAISCLSREYMGMQFPSEMKVGGNWLEAS